MTEREARAILGMEDGQPREEARSCYLRKLKTTKPEIDPEGFQRLREAWEWWQERPSAPAASPRRPRAKTKPRAAVPGVSPRTIAEPTPADVLQRSVTGLADDDIAYLERELSKKIVGDELLEAGINTVVHRYDYRNRHDTMALTGLVSQALIRSMGSDASDRLLRKWAMADQWIKAGGLLSPAAFEAIRVVLLYFESEIPEERRGSLKGLGEKSTVYLYDFPDRRLASYLDSREDLKPYRRKTRMLAGSRSKSIKMGRLLWLILVGLILLSRLVPALMQN